MALVMMLFMPATVLGASLAADINSDGNACCCSVDSAVHLEAPLECPCCAPGVPAPNVTPGVMVNAPEALETTQDVTPIQIHWPAQKDHSLEGDLARGAPPNTPIRLQICRINR